MDISYKVRFAKSQAELWLAWADKENSSCVGKKRKAWESPAVVELEQDTDVTQTRQFSARMMNVGSQRR